MANRVPCQPATATATTRPEANGASPISLFVGVHRLQTLWVTISNKRLPSVTIPVTVTFWCRGRRKLTSRFPGREPRQDSHGIALAKTNQVGQPLGPLSYRNPCHGARDWFLQCLGCQAFFFAACLQWPGRLSIETGHPNHDLRKRKSKLS